MIKLTSDGSMNNRPITISLALYAYSHIGWSIPLPGDTLPTLTSVSHVLEFRTWLASQDAGESGVAINGRPNST